MENQKKKWHFSKKSKMKETLEDAKNFCLMFFDIFTALNGAINELADDN